MLSQAVLWTVNKGRIEMLAVVLSHPLAVSLKDDEHREPLDAALFQASADRDAAMVRALLQTGASATAMRLRHNCWPAVVPVTPLHAWAAANPDISGDPRSAHSPPDRFDFSGAEGRGQARNSADTEATEQVFRMLMAAGADLHQRMAVTDNSSSAFHYARDVVAARLLVEEGGLDPGIANERGETLLGLTRDRATVAYILDKMSTKPAKWRWQCWSA